MTTTAPEAPESIQRRISALLERAAHPSTPEGERATCQEKADALMHQYRIERATFNWERPVEERRKPTHRVFLKVRTVDDEVSEASRKDYTEREIESWINVIRDDCFRFAGVKKRSKYNPDESRMEIHVFGYDEDIMYGEAVWNNAFSEILRVMFPGWSVQRGFDENVYLLKQAGYSWPQIREIGLKNGAADKNGPLTQKNAGSKLRTAYKRHATAIGAETELPKLRDPHHWRNSFVQSFSSTLQQRMAAIKAGRESYDSSNLPALQQDEDAVQDLMEEFFPPPPPPTHLTEEELAEAARITEEANKTSTKKVRYRAPRRREADLSAWSAGHSSAQNVSLQQTDQLKNHKELG